MILPLFHQKQEGGKSDVSEKSDVSFIQYTASQILSLAAFPNLPHPLPKQPLQTKDHNIPTLVHLLSCDQARDYFFFKPSFDIIIRIIFFFFFFLSGILLYSERNIYIPGHIYSELLVSYA